MDEPSNERRRPGLLGPTVEDDGVHATDLAALLADSGDGVHWTLPANGDLNANLVRLDPGHAIEEHTNAEVDVLVVGLGGSGHVVLDEHTVAIAPQVVVHLPRGIRRAIHAGPDGLGYLTVHRRRGGLTIGPAGRRAAVPGSSRT